MLSAWSRSGWAWLLGFLALWGGWWPEEDHSSAPRSCGPGNASWPDLRQYHLAPCLFSTSSCSMLLKNSLWLGFVYILWKNFDNLLSFLGGKLLQGLCHLQAFSSKICKTTKYFMLTFMSVCFRNTWIHRCLLLF